MSEEIPLKGGNVNEGIVRIGHTVRRPQNKHSQSIHALLKHLHDNGFTASPRFLGIDDKDREILNYIEGDADCAQSFWTDDSLLIDAAALLRQYHDMTVDFPFSDYQWVQSHSDSEQHEVLCHHDYAPYNLICRDNRITGIIDFDLVGPGPRLRDVAYAAYWMVPLSLTAPDMAVFAEKDIQKSHRRMNLFCDSYRIPADEKLLAMVSGVLHRMSDYENATALVGTRAAQGLKKGGHLDHWLQEATGFDANIDRYRSDTGNTS